MEALPPIRPESNVHWSGTRAERPPRADILIPEAADMAIAHTAETVDAGLVTDPSSAIRAPSFDLEGIKTRALLARLEKSSLVETARRTTFAEAFGGRGDTGGYKLEEDLAQQHPYRKDLHDTIPTSIAGFGTALETGANVGRLVRERPFDRFKFYLSLDLSTPEKVAQAQEFVALVHERAAEQKLSMMRKTESHSYDSFNIYTWEPAAMAGILKELAPAYPDIWLDVEHPLQGQVGDLNPRHIGMVQEPCGGLPNAGSEYGINAHSDRMWRIGRFIDENGGVITEEVWRTACKAVGVRPEAPWLIDPARRTQVERKVAGKLARIDEGR